MRLVRGSLPCTLREQKDNPAPTARLLRLISLSGHTFKPLINSLNFQPQGRLQTPGWVLGLCSFVV